MDSPLPTTSLALSTAANAELELLLQRQSDGWSKAQPVPIEEMLQSSLVASQLPNIHSQEWLMALISNEVMWRERAKQQPSLEEYQRRFPQLSDELRIQWEFDRFLEDRSDPTIPFLETIASTDRTDRSTAKAPQKIGRYEILCELGRGATGVVYKAWDPQLKRLLAIKRLRDGTDASSDALSRMLSEAEAVARIDHPNIVRIYEIIELDDLPVLVMDYCDGGPLSKRLTGTPLPTKVAADLVRTIARAVDVVHRSRIVHRDLKPGNVLLTNHTEWNLKVSDFGLAKLLDADSGATATGSILGTPAYMAPEQAFGDAKRVGTAADVYSVGAILYECLTGVPPFRGATVADTLQQVRERDPVAVRQLAMNVPCDLETITLKCLRKSPSDRYANMKELADDLERYLEGHPIAARPLSWVARSWRWCLRDPRAALLLASVFLSLSLSVLVLLDRNRRIRAENSVKSVALKERTEALEAKERALKESAANEMLARKRFYGAEMNLAQQAFEQDETARVLELLEHQRPKAGQVDLRGFEWDYLSNQINQRLYRSCVKRKEEISTLCFSPDGSWLAICSGSAVQGQVTIWNIETGEQRVCDNVGSYISGACFSPDSQYLLAGRERSGVAVWEVATGALKFELPTNGWTRSVAWSSDGRWMAAGCKDGVAVLWDAHTRDSIPGIQDEDDEALSVVFSKDSRRLFVGCGIDYARTYTLEYKLDELPLGAPRKIEGTRVEDVASDDGRLLGVRWGEVNVQELESGRAIWSDTVTKGSVSSARFAQDQQRFVRGGNSDRTAEIWNTSTGQVDARVAHLAPVTSVAFDPLQRYWATGSEDGVVNIWHDEISPPLHSVPFEVPVWRIALSVQDELFLGGPFPTSVRGQDDAFASKEMSERSSTLPVRFLHAVSKDGNTLLAITPTPAPEDNSLIAADTLPDQTENTTEQPPGPPMRPAYYPDSPAPGLPETIEIWDRDGIAPRLKFRLPDPKQRAWRAIALAPNGKLLATRQWEGPVRIWDVSGTSPREIHTFEASCLNFCFSGDSAYLAAACERNVVRVWDLASAQTLPDFVVEETAWRWAIVAAFSPDGKYLAGGNGSGVVRVWELSSGREISRFTARVGEVHSLAFFPNGRTLAAGGVGPITLWDFETGQELLSLPVPDYKIYQLLPTTDGQALIACSDHGNVLQWRTRESAKP